MADDLENTLILTLDTGVVTIRLRPDLATSPVSRNWRAKASMTASSSTASSRASWPRAATR